MAHALTWLDVFTARPLTGNALAVVHDADGVDGRRDARVRARDAPVGDDVRADARPSAGADYRNRIWMMQGELPFAGHPSLGTAVAVARARGERAVDLRAADRRRAAADRRRDRRRRGARLDAPGARDVRRRARPGARSSRALGPRRLRRASRPPAADRLDRAHQVIAPVREAAALDRVEPDPAALRSLLAGSACVCAYLSYIDAGPRGRADAQLLRRRHVGRRGPGHGLGRRAADGLRATRAPGPRRSRSTRASRWGARAASSARRASGSASAATSSSSSRRPSRSDRYASSRLWTRLKFAPAVPTTGA